MAMDVLRSTWQLGRGIYQGADIEKANSTGGSKPLVVASYCGWCGTFWSKEQTAETTPISIGLLVCILQKGGNDVASDNHFF